MRPARPAGAPAPETLEARIRCFLETSRDPVILEPGEEPFPALPHRFLVQTDARGVSLQVWDEGRNLVRRVTRVLEEKPGRLLLEVLRFGGRTGAVELADRSRLQSRPALRKNAQRHLAERFRRMAARQFAGWRIVQLSSGADLEHTLSANVPRAFLRRGRTGWAAVAASPGGGNSALTHGLLWLDHLRRREPACVVEGLALFLPSAELCESCLRLRALDPSKLASKVFAYEADGAEYEVDAAGWGNLDARLPLPPPSQPEPALRALLCQEGVEAIPLPGGVWSLRVRGLEFARWEAGALRQWLDPALLNEVRSPDSPDRRHPLFLRQPEAWLESVVRANGSALDASLRPAPVYGQVGLVAGVERGIIDLLAVDVQGRLAVLELKASEDPHLPVQALDYWLRVARHAAQGDFERLGYFPGIALRSTPPRLFLVAPAFAFHPTTERLLQFFPPAMEVVRVGLGVEWQQNLRVVFRVRGAERPEWDAEGIAVQDGP